MSTPLVEDRGCRVSITEQQLLCKNQCGFYGAPQWNNLCSQCYRAHQFEQKRAQHFNRNRSLLSQNDRRLSVDPKTSLRAIIKKSPSMFSTSSNNGSPTHERQSRSLSPESLAVEKAFRSYLMKNFQPIPAADLERNCKEIIETIKEHENDSMEDLSLLVVNFYKQLADKANRYRATNPEFTSTALLEQVETYISVKAHKFLFCTKTDEEVADLSLQERIRSLHWVPQIFETSLDFDSPTVEEHLDDAVNEIIYMNSHKAIEEKLACLVRCSNKIFDALKASTDAPAGADDFLPCLIYVVLKSNPPLIQSNLNFISRFGCPSKVARGESGYYFTHLSCALQFIQDMTAEKLNISNEDFEAYTTGTKKAPVARRSHVSATKSLENSLKKINVLSENQKRLSERADELVKNTFQRIDSIKSAVDGLDRELMMPPTVSLKQTVNGEIEVVQLDEKGNEIPFGEEPYPVIEKENVDESLDVTEDRVPSRSSTIVEKEEDQKQESAEPSTSSSNNIEGK
uniref:Rab5 GDP/GTP exchange factor n=1 Tax=Bursaphelenchus xylophilus TaxID=6326 RepID=A0A1I7S071_BURXY